MSSIVILGANGFLGRELLGAINFSRSVKAVVREIPTYVGTNQKNVTWIAADLMKPESLKHILLEGEIVINLAYIYDGDKTENLRLIDNVIKACLLAKSSRLIHCSTAAVAGNTKKKCVNELTLCEPSTSYERTKFEIETRLISSLKNELDVGIIRPTAIVGYGGKNLRKLANSLLNGNRITNYLKTCVMGKMPMHLVPIRNVVNALLFLADSSEKLNGNIFLISSDDEIDNNYQRVEEILLEALNLGRRRLSPIFLPRIIQLIVFRLFGRNDFNMYRTYDSKKLKDYGFEPVDSVNEAIRQFSHSIKADNSVKLASNKVID